MINVKTRLIFSFFSIFMLIACRKEELPVPKHDPGDVITATVDMKNDYRYQIFYDLETNTAVRQNLKTSWDLGFEATADGYRIILNSAKAMFARNTGIADFASVVDTNGFASNRRFDAPSGNLDTTAIGDWRTILPVYVIDRGYSETGAHQGFRKIQFQRSDANSYIFRLAELNGNGDTLFQVYKDSTYNFRFFSFAAGGQVVPVEPPKTTWDLCFTQHLEALGTPYLVTGCLLNRYYTAAKMDSLTDFNDIPFEFAQSQTLDQAINTIGYSWKKYDYGSGTYIVFPQMNYIIKDSEGFFYRLHFIDFYDTSGNKGNPRWEYQRL